MTSLISEKIQSPIGNTINIGWIGCFAILAGLAITTSFCAYESVALAACRYDLTASVHGNITLDLFETNSSIRQRTDSSALSLIWRHHAVRSQYTAVIYST